MNKYLLSLAVMCVTVMVLSAKKPVTVEPSFAWEARAPLGIRYHATIDTLLYNYYLTAVPQDYSPAVALTGNLGGATLNMIYMDRKPMGDFFPQEALSHWLPSTDSHKFYNTRIPMTLVSYLTGGGQQTSTDRLTAVFSGNAGKRLQIGANLDFIYSKGSYNYQAAKSLVWGLSTSYMGDRYELQAFFNHHNIINKENGGITDDLYIIDPAQLQGGVSTIEPKSIPTFLSASHNRVK
ncbi:MAG: putative porin, partial [Duncaniella sp.]|nr:putative porin [Duncaniella sp.]